MAFNKSISFEARVDTVVEWLSLPETTRPDVTTLYFEEPDSAGQCKKSLFVFFLHQNLPSIGKWHRLVPWALFTQQNLPDIRIRHEVFSWVFLHRPYVRAERAVDQPDPGESERRPGPTDAGTARARSLTLREYHDRLGPWNAGDYMRQGHVFAADFRSWRSGGKTQRK